MGPTDLSYPRREFSNSGLGPFSFTGKLIFRVRLADPQSSCKIYCLWWISQQKAPFGYRFPVSARVNI